MDRPQDPHCPPSVAVVIPCRNEAATIDAVLEAIAEQHRPPDEVILIDDGSTDATVDVAKSWSRRWPRIPFLVVRGEGRGPAAAMNAGIARASSEIIVRLDGHCRPNPQYIASALETLASGNAGVVGGVWDIRPGVSTPVGRAIAAVVSHPVGSGGASYRNADHAALREVDTVPFGCFRRSVWLDMGGYDEALVSNEDYDFNFRVRQSGRKVILVPAMRAVYWSRPTLDTLARQYFRYGFWKMQMLGKSPRAFRLRQLPPALVMPWLVITICVAAWSGHTAAIGLATLYPAVIATTTLLIAAREPRLLMPVLAAILVQHLSWSAGFWQGLIRLAQMR